VVTIVSIVFMYQGQRRIPVQQARRVIGRKMYAGRSSYIPLRLNNAGVISIIFAISILLLPQQALSWFGGGAQNTHSVAGTVSFYILTYFGPSSVLYNLVYFLLVVIFTFFYSAIGGEHQRHRRQPQEIGLVHPGDPARPADGRLHQQDPGAHHTAAALYLGVLAVLPSLQRNVGVTSLYIGSTSLLIVVGVALDSITQIEARLAMRDYRGFINR